MENRAYAFIAGLFAILLCGGLIAGFWWLGGSHTEENEYVVSSKYPVAGLNPQAAVRYRGVDAGRVRFISLDPGNPKIIWVTISVNSNLKLTRGAFAQLASQGLTGLSYIELDDTGENLAPIGDQQIPMLESNLSQMVNSGKEIMNQTKILEQDAARLIKTLNHVLDDDNVKKINKLLANMEQSSSELEALMKSSHAATDKANRLLDEIRPQELSKTLEAVRQASVSMKETSDTARPTLAQMQHSLQEFERIGKHIEQSSMELGDTFNDETLPRVHELTRQLQQDARSINRLVDNLEQHPNSVIFGKPQPAPGPGEKGFKP
jgi:phospholipid/cholesterol/gamma-HCH transport system substrate-binding protein